jgi:hypothetical protein
LALVLRPNRYSCIVVIGFAVLGVIQIRNLKIDFREIAKNAIEDAKNNIDKKTDEVKK